MAVFIDSNILAYVVDKRDVKKHNIAAQILDDALDGITDCRLSTQTLSEFANVALKKLGLGEDVVREYVEVFKSLHAISQDPEIVERALEIKARYDLQFYDSMIVAAAERTGCNEILSEDFNDGQAYCGIVVRNPFKR